MLRLPLPAGQRPLLHRLLLPPPIPTALRLRIRHAAFTASAARQLSRGRSGSSSYPRPAQSPVFGNHATRPARRGAAFGNERDEAAADEEDAALLRRAESSAAGEMKGDDDEEAATSDDEEDAAATGEDMARLAQQLLAVEDPVMTPIDQLSALATEFTPLAAGVRWLRLSEVGVVAPVPRGWALSSGTGRILGVPFVTYVASFDGEGSRQGPAGSGGGSTAHSLGITVTQYRGAFSSQLLAAAHGSPQDVCRFFGQMHVVKRSPPGLITAEAFAGDASPLGDGSGSRSGGGGSDPMADMMGSMMRGGGTPGRDGAPLIGHGDASRKPDILASWHKGLKREDVMPGGADAPTGQVVRIPVAQAAQTVFASLKAQASGVPASSPSSASSARRCGHSGGSGAATASPSASANSSSGPPPLTARESVIHGHDTIDVYGVEYAMKYSPAAATPPPSGSFPAASSVVASTNRGGSASRVSAAAPHPAPRGRQRGGTRTPPATPTPLPPTLVNDADDGGIARWGMRYSVTYIADPAADSVHEITFACPAEVWDALWEHDDAGGVSAQLFGLLGRGVVAPATRTGGGVALASTVGLLHITAAALMDAVTVTGVAERAETAAAASPPQHQVVGYGGPASSGATFAVSDHGF